MKKLVGRLPMPSLSLPRATKTLVTLLPAAIAAMTASSALAYPGEQLLAFSANNIIAPLGIIAVVVFLAGSLFRPDMAKHAVYAIVICAVLYCVIKYAPQLMTAVKTS